uniref:Uncharacterized protein n=1 Tax=Anopheles quadriannulatus TaxID=34691 RepID=A0A182XSS8_ANOQN
MKCTLEFCVQNKKQRKTNKSDSKLKKIKH